MSQVFNDFDSEFLLNRKATVIHLIYCPARRLADAFLCEAFSLGVYVDAQPTTTALFFCAAEATASKDKEG